jgi:hypothetical protein
MLHVARTALLDTFYMKQISEVERKPFMFLLEYLSRGLDRKGWGWEE